MLLVHVVLVCSVEVNKIINRASKIACEVNRRRVRIRREVDQLSEFLSNDPV